MRANLIAPLSLLLLTGAVAPTKPPSIQGTYRLVSRDLPDGTRQVPPNIVGLLTFTAKYRNFNIYWKDPNGKAVSLSNIATYQLSDKEYRETNVYYFVNDETQGKKPSYDLAATSGASPITIKGTRIEMQLPLHEEPMVAFDGDRLTASSEGEFVDHWVRVP